MNLTYIVAQSAESFYLVDQHAAHERVVFERLSRSFNCGQMDVQTLLLPLAIDLSETEADALMAHKAAFEKMGLSLERLSPESVVVQTLPSLIQENAIVEALKKAAHDLVTQGGSSALETRVGDLFATMACHSVVRAGQSLSLEQMKQLLVQMDEFPLSSFCPHGRPVFVRRRFQDIEREFDQIIARSVLYLTDEQGENRKTRKKLTNQKLASIQVTSPFSTVLIVKSADRLGNMRNCVRMNNHGLLKMYIREYTDFKVAAYRHNLCDDIWVELERIVNQY
jgi:hypothetical protein